MKRHLILLALALPLGCGGQTGTLALTIVTPPADDPFAHAASARITVGDSSHVTTVPVSGGQFTVNYSRPPSSTPGIVTVEALDSGNNVIAHGSTPTVDLSATDNDISVWVAKPGIVETTASAFPTARNDIAAVNVPGLGALFAGGQDSNGPTADNEVYDVYTQTLIMSSAMSKPRAGAVAAAVGNTDAVALGGVTAKSALDNTMELFDPSSTGIWAPVPISNWPARRNATATQLSSGSTLVTGGFDANGNALADAAVISDSGTIALGELPAMMTAPRGNHVIAAAHFTDGDGAIVFGGLAAGSMATSAERFVNQQFSTYDVGQPSRDNATATTLPSGKILILGGKDSTGALASGFVVTPNLPTADVTPLAQAMSVAREGHTASLTGSDVIVCGGADAGGNVQASCDVIDASSFTIKRTVPLAVARRDHSAVVLDNNLVVIAAGNGSDGNPVASIEIYSP